MSKYISKEQLLQDKVDALEKEVEILRNRLHLSKQANRENRDRLRSKVKYFEGEATKWYGKWYKEVMGGKFYEIKADE
jgi:hypothetical protein